MIRLHADSLLKNADWPKRTADRISDLQHTTTESLREHLGPGPHPSGSEQSVHGTRGGEERFQAVKAWGLKKFGDEKKAENFANWFGDSQAVDENGHPLTVYHGTDQKFDQFEIGRTGVRSVMFDTREVETQGVFFSSSHEDAKTYGDNVMPAYLSAQNPFSDPSQFPASTKDPESMKGAKKAWEDAEYIFEPLVYEKNGSKFVDTNYGISATEIDEDGEWVSALFPDGKLDWNVLDEPKVVKRMKERGYDSAFVSEQNDESGASWFITSPNQIKSATGNRGTFDPNSPKINEAHDGTS